MLYGAVKGALHLIANSLGAGTTSIHELGLTPKVYEEVTSEIPWIAAQRTRMRAALDALCHATTDLAGLPRIEIPAEYVAAVIAVFVSPVNTPLACSFMGERFVTSADAASVGEPPPQGMEHMTAAQLLALVCQIHGDDDGCAVRAQFEKALSRKVKEVTQSA